MKTNALRKLTEIFNKNPNILMMDQWAKHLFSEEEIERRCGCKTVGCIAGWSEMLRLRETGLSHEKAAFNVDNKGSDEMVRTGMKNLGLTKPQALRLFYLENWPRQFRTAYFNPREEGLVGRERYIKEAEVTGQRIEHFIETKGKE